MRRQFLLERVVRVYRVAAIIGIAFVALMAGLAGWAFAAMRWPGLGQPYLALSLIGVCLLVMAVALHWSYIRLRQGLGDAAAEQSRLIDSAHEDALTGAFTRSYFLDRLRQHLQDGAPPVAYLQIDMDRLKVINDSDGHAAGDAALVRLVRTLKTLMPEAIIGRLGGDEFGVAIIGHDNKPALRRLGDRILTELGKPVQGAVRPIQLSATIGLAVWPHDAAEVTDLLSRADLALYKGKRNGRAATIAFDREFLADERYKRFVERDLRAAILLDELEVAYQPIFTAADLTISSHEALVRWRHTVRGQILPPEFIPIAEQSELIDRLGDWVLARACKDIEALGGTPVGVNVSARQLRRSDFVSRFSAILDEHRVRGDHIVVEVTESVPMLAGSAELAGLEALRRLGVRVAIDDFGAGHASLEYLRGFPFDIIKIDRSYVSNLPHSRIDGLIVSAVCEIARSMHLEVVAEGVETEEQLAFLRKAGCTSLQGFLLGRPAAAPGAITLRGDHGKLASAA